MLFILISNHSNLLFQRIITANSETRSLGKSAMYSYFKIPCRRAIFLISNYTVFNNVIDQFLLHLYSFKYTIGRYLICFIRVQGSVRRS